MRLAAVVPTYAPRHALVVAARRSWRRGLPAVVATNGTAERRLAAPSAAPEGPGAALEAWWEYPDSVRPTGYTPGDMRMLASLRLANATLRGAGGAPAFDWLLFADDDVFWNVAAVREMLAPLDPAVPYWITDDLLGCCHHSDGCDDSPACLLPGRGVAEERGPGGCVLHPVAAPCRWADLHGDGVCPAPRDETWFHGGHGALFSRGLMDLVPEATWRGCEAAYGGGGDARISRCLVERAGVAPTSPSGGHFERCVFGRARHTLVLDLLRRFKTTGVCKAQCRAVLVEQVSTAVPVGHGKGDRLHSADGSDRSAEALLELEALYAELRPRAAAAAVAAP